MIVTFGNKLARDLVEELPSKEFRTFPGHLVRIARKKLLMVHVARELIDLKAPPGNRLEKLKGKRRDSHSIRINEQWRVVFRFEGGNAYNVTVEDYHS
jgi:proteic killer suppression protein